MALRLTGKDIRNTTILKVDKDNMHIYNTTTEDGEEKTVISCDAITRLGKLEDILEEYGIESVEELEKKIGYYIDKIDLEAENDYLKKAIEKQNVVTQSISKDRDTWKRTCEFLAYEYAEEYFDGRDIEHCFNTDKRDKFVKENINYFYQQAKKESESK